MRTIALCLVLAGCFRTTVTNTFPGDRPAAVGTKWKHGFISGIVEVEPIQLDRACPANSHWLWIHDQVTVLSSIAMLVTFGLYTPRVAMVYCSGPQPGSGNAAPPAEPR